MDNQVISNVSTVNTMTAMNTSIQQQQQQNQQLQQHQPDAIPVILKESYLSTTSVPPVDIPKNNNNNDTSENPLPVVQDSNVFPNSISNPTLPSRPTTTISYGSNSSNPLIPSDLMQQSNLEQENSHVKQESQLLQQQQQISSQKAMITKVKLSDELNLFDWFKTKEIINQIAEKAKSSVESVVTVLDPGMKEYLYSGGNINIMVIAESNNLISPIRDAFQTVFGRATVTAARSSLENTNTVNKVKLASGFNESVTLAQEKIRSLREDTSKVPQNQVVIAVQPSLVKAINSAIASNQVTNGLQLDDNLLPEYFLTYAMIIEDPILGATMSCFSQFIPIDTDIVKAAQEVEIPAGDIRSHLGYPISIDDLMTSKLKMSANVPEHNQRHNWLQVWSGLNEEQLMNDLSISLAHMYRRKWNDCVN